jgi:hypothetical protein
MRDHIKIDHGLNSPQRNYSRFVNGIIVPIVGTEGNVEVQFSPLSPRSENLPIAVKSFFTGVSYQVGSDGKANLPKVDSLESVIVIHPDNSDNSDNDEVEDKEVEAVKNHAEESKALENSPNLPYKIDLTDKEIDERNIQLLKQKKNRESHLDQVARSSRNKAAVPFKNEFKLVRNVERYKAPQNINESSKFVYIAEKEESNVKSPEEFKKAQENDLEIERIEEKKVAPVKKKDRKRYQHCINFNSKEKEIDSKLKRIEEIEERLEENVAKLNNLHEKSENFKANVLEKNDKRNQKPQNFEKKEADSVVEASSLDVLEETNNLDDHDAEMLSEVFTLRKRKRI